MQHLLRMQRALENPEVRKPLCTAKAHCTCGGQPAASTLSLFWAAMLTSSSAVISSLSSAVTTSCFLTCLTVTGPDVPVPVFLACRS